MLQAIKITITATLRWKTPPTKSRQFIKQSIKTKYGQVREQDRVRLNNRVEQKLRECREMAGIAEDFFFQEHAIIKKP